MKRYLILIVTILSLLSSITYGQSIDVETENFPETKKLIIKTFNGCCAQKGFRAIYYFDNIGQAIKSSNYFKRQLRASYEYNYNNNGLLIEKIQTFDINNKNRKDTTKYDYIIDKNGRVTTKTERFGRWTVVENFSDFDSLNNPQTVLRVFDNQRTLLRKKYNLHGKEILNQKLENDTIVQQEESKYNEYGDLIFSNIPTLLDKETGKMVSIIGGNRHSIIEVYEYTYANRKRWTEKYVVFDNKKVLLEKRIYK